MPRKQPGLRRKKKAHMMESPFPVSFLSSPEESVLSWFYYTGFIEGTAVVVKHTGDMDFLYKMGFFGKGNLSRSQPSFQERKPRVQMKLMKNGLTRLVSPAVMNKRSYLVHKRYKALAEGRTKEYRDIVHHEEQQQGFLDSSDEEIPENSSDDSSSDATVESERLEAFKLLSSQNLNMAKVGQDGTDAYVADNTNLGNPHYTSGKIRSQLVSILAQVSLLSNEQITSFLQVPQDAKQLAEKYQKMRNLELNVFRQTSTTRLLGRNIRQGEIITVDEDDSATENKNVNTGAGDAVVISDSDDDDDANVVAGKVRNTSESKKADLDGCGRKGENGETGEKVENSKRDTSILLASSSRNDSNDDLASDDFNFWETVSQCSQQKVAECLNNKEKAVETSNVEMEESRSVCSVTNQVSTVITETLNLSDNTRIETDGLPVKTETLKSILSVQTAGEDEIKISVSTDTQDTNCSKEKASHIDHRGRHASETPLFVDNDVMGTNNVCDSLEGKNQYSKDDDHLDSKCPARGDSDSGHQSQNNVENNSGSGCFTDRPQKMSVDSNEHVLKALNDCRKYKNTCEETSKSSLETIANECEANKSSQENKLSDDTATLTKVEESFGVNSVTSDIVDNNSEHKVIDQENERWNTADNSDVILSRNKVVSGDECNNTAEMKFDVPNFHTDAQTESMSSFVQNGKCTENNDNIVQRYAEIVNDNSNDSDDVICIESQSAEPKKLHTFLSQAVNTLSSPVITKSVTFMSNNSAEPTYVFANVGFRSWSPLVHFSFTGDPTHLPTVMSVPSHTEGNEGTSHCRQQKSPNVMYERIYPPVKSLVPNSISKGAVIKQRHKALPCLSTAFLKVSKMQETLSSKITSCSENSNISKKISHQLAEARPLVAKFIPYSKRIVENAPVQPSASQNAKLSPSVSHSVLSLPSSLFSNSPKIQLSHIHSYLKAYQCNQTSGLLNLADNSDTELFHNDTETSAKISSLLVSISAVLNRIETSYINSASENTQLGQEKQQDEVNVSLLELNTLLSEFLNSIDISSATEFYLIKLLLSKCENLSGIPNENLHEAKKSLSAYHIWLLEKRFKICEQNLQTNKSQCLQNSVDVDLTANSSLGKNISCKEESKTEMNQFDSDIGLGPAIHPGYCMQTNSSSSNPPPGIEMFVETNKHGNSTLESENRKRKFDRYNKQTDQIEKKLKSCENDLTSGGTENNETFNFYKSEHSTDYKDGKITDNDKNSNQRDVEEGLKSEEGEGLKNQMKMEEELGNKLEVEEGLKNHVEVKEGLMNQVESKISSHILNMKESSSHICHDELSVKENETVTTSSSNKPQNTPAASNSDSSAHKGISNSDNEIVDKKCPDTACEETTDCSEQHLITKSTGKISQSEILCTSSDVKPPQSYSHEANNGNGTENCLWTNSKQIQNLGNNCTASDLICEDKNMERRAQLDQSSNFTTTTVHPNHSSSSLCTDHLRDGQLLKDENKCNNQTVTMNAGTHLITSKSGCGNGYTRADSTGPDLKEDAVSDNNKSFQTVREDKLKHADNGEDFQILIGSSSEEEKEHVSQTRGSHISTYDDVHPCSIDDDSNGDLFVMPNTSDEDQDEDDNSDNKRKQNSRIQQQRWRPCVKMDPYHTNERLYLMLEEAFFLSFGLGCLRVMDPEMKLLDLTQMWQQFQVLKEQFIPHYVAYHYFRSKGWVPKSGIKFGCDLILYQEGPPFCHGSYSVIVIAVKDNTLLPLNKNDGLNFDHRKLNWTSLAGLNRITEHVAKELMLCYVIWPSSLTQEETLSPDCISKFMVKEVIVTRWISSQERENQLGEEEIP